MANIKFDSLPTVGSAQLTDIICAVQNNTSVQETLQQVANLMLSNTILSHSGNPNGFVAGIVYQLCWDSLNGILYVCTTTGGAMTAVWSTSSGLTLPLSLSRGGTGASLTASLGGVVYSGSSAFAISSVGSPGQLFQSAGSSIPSWTTATYPSSVVSNQILYASGTNTVSGLNSANNGVLNTNGSGVPQITSTLPTAVQLNITELGTINTGIWNATTLSSTYGGTGLSNPTAHGILVGEGSSPVNPITLTNGQLLIGSTGNDPTASTLTAGTGISISNASGSITINSIGGGTNWNVVTSSPQAMTSNNGYIANSASLVNLVLPTSSSVGDTLKIVGKGSGGWTITYTTSQYIVFGSSTTTISSGSLSSTNAKDNVYLVCTVANTEWTVSPAPQGILTVV